MNRIQRAVEELDGQWPEGLPKSRYLVFGDELYGISRRESSAFICTREEFEDAKKERHPLPLPDLKPLIESINRFVALNEALCRCIDIFLEVMKDRETNKEGE